MFINLSKEQKEERFMQLNEYAEKIGHPGLRNACISILRDYKEELFCRSAGHDGIENQKNDRTHHCFDGGLLDHILHVTKNAYDMGTTYGEKVDMDLILFGAILHDIGKVKIFDPWNEQKEVKANLNYSYLLVDHVYLGEALVERYLEKEDISEKFKYQVLHIIATHMDTMEKHMAEAYIVSFADSVDAVVENIISYPRNQINPIMKNYIYESVNDERQNKKSINPN